MFKLSNSEYSEFVKARSPGTKPFANVVRAFAVGGGICVFAEALTALFEFLGLANDTAKISVTVVLVFLAALLTAIHVYDDIAKFAGAGIVVPITGFANSVASPAIEFKTEGLILGTAAKMFVVAGPVIVYGTVASIIYGIVYWITTIL
ncbi:MAG: SpoVA/SpoVAEb family sporulation membrane protein [Eubacteriales bacterium]